MPPLKPGDVELTPEENAALLADIEADPDDYELDAEWFAKARPAIEIVPDLVEYSRRRDAMGLLGPLPDKPVRGKLEAIFAQSWPGGKMANNPHQSLRLRGQGQAGSAPQQLGIHRSRFDGRIHHPPQPRRL